MKALEPFRDAYREAGMSEELIERALRLARPRIALRGTGGEDSPVVGRYGGHPQLPPDVHCSGYPDAVNSSDYPDFIASVDCAALPVGELDIALPQDGHLLFFAQKSYSEWSPESAGRVVYVPAGTATVERIAAEEDLPTTCAPYPLRARLEWEMPDSNENLDFTEGVHPSELPWVDRDVNAELALGGYSFPIQSDPCDRSGDPDEQLILLARAEYELVYEPFQCVAYWLIRHRDLVERNFDRVAFTMQCYM